MTDFYGTEDLQSGGQNSTKRKGVDEADDSLKIFVGGLSWETTNEELKAYFEQFGVVSDSTIKLDPNTGRSRGFGFVVFSEPSCVDAVLAQGKHTLSGKDIDPKRAKARGPEPIKKIFVGGLDPTIPESDIREYFGQYGNIEELSLPFDKVNNVRKSFAFITFDSAEAVDQLCINPKHTVSGKSVEVKKATPKPEVGQGGFGGRGGRGSFGGPRGGRGGRGGGRGYGGGYGYGGWDGSAQGYGGGYEPYSGFVAPGSSYGQDPYSQQYGGGGYDYSGWYGAQAGQMNGSSYGRAPRGGSVSDARYQPYSR